tara:strand:+ start:130 stop:399 length:270 start_codon:yes stop_codon:yes gene_type:complete
MKKKDSVKTEDILLANTGDFCYYLTANNKILFAEIKNVFEENGVKVFQMIDQTDFRFVVAPAKICAFNEKDLKGKKRNVLCPEVFKDVK